MLSIDALLSATNNLPWWVIPILITIIFLRFVVGNPKHAWRIRSARKAIRNLKAIENPAQQFAYLRKVDPFVFEEMILTSLKETGFTIKRNRRYTGDGGIDGRAVINGQKIFIQAKRYSSHISSAHVSEFSELCRMSGKKGLFVHTGKTGKQAWINGKEAGHVDIVSGARMLQMLTGSGYTPNWQIRQQN